jgi:hypothetical protein
MADERAGENLVRTHFRGREEGAPAAAADFEVLCFKYLIVVGLY